MNIFNKKNNSKFIRGITCLMSMFELKKTLLIVRRCKALQKLLGINKYTYMMNKVYHSENVFVLKKDSNKNKSAKNNAIINATMQITGLTNLNLTSAMSVDIDTGCSYVNTICNITKELVVIAQGKENKIIIYDIKNNKIVKTLQGHSSSVLKIFNNDSHFISAAFNGEIIQWNYVSLNIDKKVKYNSSGMINIILINSLQSFCASYWDLSIEIFTIDALKYKITSQSNQPTITLSSYNDMLIASNRNKSIYVYKISNENYELTKSQSVNAFDDKDKYITCINVISTEKVFCGYSNGSIISMNLSFTKCFYCSKLHSNPIMNLVSINGGSKVISTAINDRTLNIINVNDMRERVTLISKISFDGCLLLLDNSLLVSKEGKISTVIIDNDKYTMKIEKRIILYKEL